MLNFKTIYFKSILSVWFILMLLAFLNSPTELLSGLTKNNFTDLKSELNLSILRVRKIRMNAYFPDIVFYKGSIFISYREACAHSDSASLGRVVILKSEDEQLQIEIEGIDDWSGFA